VDGPGIHLRAGLCRRVRLSDRPLRQRRPHVAGRELQRGRPGQRRRPRLVLWHRWLWHRHPAGGVRPARHAPGAIHLRPLRRDPLRGELRPPRPTAAPPTRSTGSAIRACSSNDSTATTPSRPSAATARVPAAAVPAAAARAPAPAAAPCLHPQEGPGAVFDTAPAAAGLYYNRNRFYHPTSAGS